MKFAARHVTVTAMGTTDNEKVMIGMSGGVDSTVAAFLLKNSGLKVLGVTLILTEDDDGKNAEDAKEIADKLGIPHITCDLREEFKRNVTDYFIEEYKNGRTPNPCIVCNKKIKFGKMMEIAEENGCGLLATGHYAKIDDENGVYYLKKADFLEKDQSYFLYNLTQEQLAKIVFPLADFPKDAVRSLAEELSLKNAKKKDSQDVCFIPDGDKNAYLSRHLEASEGNFVDTNGNILGTHKGIYKYTIGQRKGLGVAFGEPMYVAEINEKTNTVVLGKASEGLVSSFYVDAPQLHPDYSLDKPLKCTVKPRFNSPCAPCILEKCEGGYRVTLDTPQRAIAPGQSAVFYDGDIVIGGAVITKNA